MVVKAVLPVVEKVVKRRIARVQLEDMISVWEVVIEGMVVDVNSVRKPRQERCMDSMISGHCSEPHVLRGETGGVAVRFELEAVVVDAHSCCPTSAVTLGVI